VKLLGRMVLNRNPDNFFAETEQAAFHPGHIVPGIDFSNDPLLQGRLFSYTDTQLSRLGGPNFNQIPINQPLCPFHNNQRDGLHQHLLHKGRAAYEPNSIDAGWPKETPPAARQGGFSSYHEPMTGAKVRVRAASFADHFTQAALFYHSLSDAEQGHVVAAYAFELSKVERMTIREREVNEILANICPKLAEQVASQIGVKVTNKAARVPQPATSPALSQANLLAGDIRSRKVAILIADGVSEGDVSDLRAALEKAGARARLIGPSASPVKADNGAELIPDASWHGLPSVAFDGVYVPGGAKSVQSMGGDGRALHYLLEAYKHLKPLAFAGDAQALPGQLGLAPDEGIVQGGTAADVFAGFEKALKQHRIWVREAKVGKIPA